MVTCIAGSEDGDLIITGETPFHSTILIHIECDIIFEVALKDGIAEIRACMIMSKVRLV